MQSSENIKSYNTANVEYDGRSILGEMREEYMLRKCKESTACVENAFGRRFCDAMRSAFRPVRDMGCRRRRIA
jgi:hypothetical protein